MNNEKAHETYDDYFEFRDVAPDFYRGYRLPAYLRGVLPREREARILDIGCGLGHVLKALRQEGYADVSGIDISASAVAACVAEGLDVVRTDSIAGYRCDRRFDFIIMSHVLEHIEKDEVIETLRAIRENLLADGGALLVMTPNAQSHTGCYWAYEDFTHRTLFTAGSLAFVLRSAGFATVDFVDPTGTAGSSLPGRLVKEAFIFLYRMKFAFWNIMTDSSFHKPSPQIFTFEIKAVAR